MNANPNNQLRQEKKWEICIISEEGRVNYTESFTYKRRAIKWLSNNMPEMSAKGYSFTLHKNW